MSRAVLRVVMYGSTEPAFSRHFSATVRAHVTSEAKVSGRYGRSKFCSLSSSPQVIGLLAPTPRGSKPMRSYWSRTSLGIASFISRGRSRPEPPGPPGLNSMAPCRLAGFSLFSRDMARSIVRPSGRR